MGDLFAVTSLLDAGADSATDTAAPSWVALQRVCVRLLFDPAFVERVYADPHRELADLGIPAQLIDQLVTNDRRVWNADRLRRSRALKVLMEEFKVSSALLLAATRRFAELDAFFSSERFHRAVQRRGYMAVAYAAYLGDQVAVDRAEREHLAAVLVIERGMARARRLLREARRGRDPAGGPGAAQQPGPRWACRPGVVAVAVPGGTLAVIQHVEHYLFETGLIPALALCDDAPRPEPLPPLDAAAPEAFLLEPGAEGKVELSGIPLRYHHLITACTRPATLEELSHALSREKMTRAQVGEMVEALEEAEILRRVYPDPASVVGPSGENGRVGG